MIDRRDAGARSPEPSCGEVMQLALCACAALAIGIQLAAPGAGFWEYEPGDTFTYVEIARAARTWDWSGLREVRLFWGTSFLTAALAWVSGLGDLQALLVICMASSLASVCLSRRLWGGWVAGFLCVVSWDWLQASALGGSETVFVALGLAAFVAAREERWALAALAASGSTTIRPVGYILFTALLASLIWKRKLRAATIAGSIGMAVIAISFLPVWSVRGEPFAQIHGYQRDWDGGQPLGLPFVALAQGMMRTTSPFALLLPLAWIMLLLAGTAAALARPAVRDYARRHPAEAIFFLLYLAFLFCYRSTRWSWVEFPRFAIPALPFALFALEPWLPKSRRALWWLAPASGLTAAGRLVGFHALWSSLPWQR